MTRLVTAPRRVAVAGVGYSTVGRRTGLSLYELAAQSCKAAMDDAGLTPKDIDGVSSHCFPNQFIASHHIAGMLGTKELSWLDGSVEGPAFIVAAIHAASAVASGVCETAMAVRTLQRQGRSAPIPPPISTTVGEDAQFTTPLGAVATAQFNGMFMQRMMHEFGWTEEDFGRQMVAQRHFASLNPQALHRDPITLDDYMAARYICKPARLLDCDYPVDASGAVIFTTAERARDLRHPPVFVEAWSFGSQQQTVFDLVRDMTDNGPHSAAAKMWAQTDLTPADVDVAGLYDGFNFIVFQWLEAFGFCGRGEAAGFVKDGHTALGGSLPVNCDGGAVNVGRVHGVNHIREVVEQLRGTSGERQTPGARVGVSANSVASFTGCMLFTAD